MTSEHHSDTSAANGATPMSAAKDRKTQPPTGQTTGKPKIVKRYSNRKLYDTERSKYVTLDEIARMIKAGEEVTIIDNETKEDLTSVTLTQIIYEEEKRESRMPLAMLRNLIQTGGTSLQDFFDRSVKTPVVEGIDSAQKSVEKSVEELRQSALQIKDNAARGVSGITDAARRLFSREERKAEEFQKAFKILFDHLDERLAARITDVRSTKDEIKARLEQTPPKPDGDSAEAEAAAPEGSSDEPLRVDTHVQMIRERLAAVQEKLEELAKLS